MHKDYDHKEHPTRPVNDAPSQALLASDDNLVVLYPSSFEGWLCAVFYVYEQRLQHHQALRLTDERHYQPALIDCVHRVTVEDKKAARVLSKLNRLLGKSGMRQLLWGFLSEQPKIGTTLFNVVKYALDYPSRQVLQDVGNFDVLTLAQTVKSVGREKHRMEAFVRFEHTTEDIYFARISPDFNVLPLISEHFRQRYQDQNWAIYDLARHYGVYYDKSQSTPKRPAALQTITQMDDDILRDPTRIHSEHERRYQQFWQGYFANVNITERKNARLHKQYLPQRYWKLLSEKQVTPDARHLEKKR